MLPNPHFSAPGLALGTAASVARRRVWYRPLAAPAVAASPVAASPYVSGGENTEPTTRPVGAALAGPLKPLLAARAALACAGLAALWALGGAALHSLGSATAPRPLANAHAASLPGGAYAPATRLPARAVAGAYLATHGAWVGAERRRLGRTPATPAAAPGYPLTWAWGDSGLTRPRAEGWRHDCRAYAAAWGGLLEGPRPAYVGRGRHVSEGAAVAGRTLAPALALWGPLGPTPGEGRLAAVRPAAGRPAACDRAKQWSL